MMKLYRILNYLKINKPDFVLCDAIKEIINKDIANLYEHREQIKENIDISDGLMDKLSKAYTLLTKNKALRNDKIRYYPIETLMELRDFKPLADYMAKECKNWIAEKDMHHYIVESILEELEETNKEIWLEIDYEHLSEIYDNGEILSEGDVKASIITNSMLQYDSMIFWLLEDGELRNAVETFYRPYFVEYLIDIKSIDQRFIHELLDRGNETNIFRCQFAEDNVVDERAVQGYLVSSASPIVLKGKKLVINDKLNDKEKEILEDTYKIKGKYCSSGAEVIRTLQNIFPNVLFNKARIYKVGNGNSIYIYGKSNGKRRRLLYDIGIDYGTTIYRDSSKMKKEYQPAVNSIRNLQPHAVIISHWDSDHYMGCVYARKEIFNCKWIAPDFEKASKNAKRLGKYMYLRNKLLMLSNDNPMHFRINNKKTEFYLCKGKKKDSHITKQNCEGIAVSLCNRIGKNNRVKVLMQGDVPYKSMPAGANFSGNNPYDYLIVPHHGSEMDVSLLRSSRKNGIAVISCNGKGNKRPFKAHADALKKCYQEVILTESASKAVLEINLCKKMICSK